MSERRFTKVFICDSTFKINVDISHEIMSELSPGARIFIESGQISLPRFKEYNYETFITQLVNLRDILKRYKISLNAKIIALLRDENGDSVGVSIKPKAKEIQVDEGNIKVIFAKNIAETKKKPLTKEEKLALLREWHNEYPSEAIDDKTKYKNFALGKFCSKAIQDADTKIQIDSILNE